MPTWRETWFERHSPLLRDLERKSKPRPSGGRWPTARVRTASLVLARSVHRMERECGRADEDVAGPTWLKEHAKAAPQLFFRQGDMALGMGGHGPARHVVRGPDVGGTEGPGCVCEPTRRPRPPEPGKQGGPRSSPRAPLQNWRSIAPLVPADPTMACATRALLMQDEDRMQPRWLCAEEFARNGTS